MFLHNDKELFQEVIVSAAEDLDLVVPIVEKDYYVTMILKKLSIQHVYRLHDRALKEVEKAIA